MFARFLATFCLLTSGIGMATAASPTVAISLRLRTGTVPAAAFEELQKELAGLMNAAGVTAQWEDPQSYRDVSGSTVVLDLTGDCSIASHAETVPVADGMPLGSTAIADNRLLPFVNVDCSALAGLVSPFVANQPEAFREFVFGRALGRVLAHELYHIVTQSETHPDFGVAKASFTAHDLMKNRFEFDEMTVGRIHASQTANLAPETFASGAAAGFGDVAADGK